MNRTHHIGGLVPYKEIAKRLLQSGKSKQELIEHFRRLLEQAVIRREELKETIEWLENMKNPDLVVFVEYLKTLAEQGFIDVEPTERDYNLTPIYDFLVISGIADRAEEKYWLRLVNEDACSALIRLLEEAQPDVLGTTNDNSATCSVNR